MEQNIPVKVVCFHSLKRKYSHGDDIPCTVSVNHLESDLKDEWIGLYNTAADQNEINIIKQLLPYPIDKQETSSQKTITVIFRGESVAKHGSGVFQFRYVSGDKVIARSSNFEIGPLFSEHDLITLQSDESFDDTMLLVNKMSTTRVLQIEEDNKKLKEKLLDAKDENTQLQHRIDIINTEKNAISQKLEEERISRETAEKSVEELGRKIADEMQIISIQTQKITSVERDIIREKELGAALKDDFDSQKSIFNAIVLELEDAKAMIESFRKECKTYKAVLEEERMGFNEASARFDHEIVRLKREMNDKSESHVDQIRQVTDENLSLKESLKGVERNRLKLEENVKHLKEKLKKEQDKRKSVENLLQVEVTSLREELTQEKEKSASLMDKYTCTMKDYQILLETEKTKQKALELGLKTAEKQVVKSNEEIEALNVKLKATREKLEEMELLLSSSKEELVTLREALGDSDDVSSLPKSSQTNLAPPTGSDKSLSAKSSGIGVATSLIKCNYIVRECFDVSREKRQADRLDLDRPYEARSSFRDFDRERRHVYSRAPFERMDRETLEKQYCLIRQHRNSLLRENSRFRHTMAIISHDYAIMQYSMHQALNEVNEQLVEMESICTQKESECAALRNQLQMHGIIPFNDINIQNDTIGMNMNWNETYALPATQSLTPAPTYVESSQSFPSQSAFVRNAGFTSVNNVMQDGYYEIFTTQNNLVLSQPMTVGASEQHVQQEYQMWSINQNPEPFSYQYL